MLKKYGSGLFVAFWIFGCFECFLVDEVSRCPRSLRYRRHVTSYHEHCYEFVIDKTDYWDTANDDCKSRGGHLVVIKNQYEQMFLMTALRSLGYKGTSLWIGLSDQKKEHEWRWATGERLDGYSHWSKGEDAAGIFHSLQDCVFMRYTEDGRWFDTTCHVWPEYFNYICQYDLLPTTTLKTTTPTTTTTTSTSTTPTKITLPPTSVGCSEIDCGRTCINGYTGLQVGLDGCIHCICS